MMTNDFNLGYDDTGKSLYSVDPCDPACHSDRRYQAAIFRWVTLGVGASLIGVSVINFIFFRKYKA